MPKYYCDYCDTHLTHDSPSVRKTHCAGRKHRDNVRIYYQHWMEEKAQHMIDETTAAFKSRNSIPGSYTAQTDGGGGVFNFNTPPPPVITTPTPVPAPILPPNTNYNAFTVGPPQALNATAYLPSATVAAAAVTTAANAMNSSTLLGHDILNAELLGMPTAQISMMIPPPPPPSVVYDRNFGKF